MKGLEQLSHAEHMTEDELGLHNEQFHQDLSLLQYKQAHPVTPNAVSAEWCADYGNEIPEARRQAVPGVDLCVACARDMERKQRLYR